MTWPPTAGLAPSATWLRRFLTKPFARITLTHTRGLTSTPLDSSSGRLPEDATLEVILNESLKNVHKIFLENIVRLKLNLNSKAMKNGIIKKNMFCSKYANYSSYRNIILLIAYVSIVSSLI